MKKCSKCHQRKPLVDFHSNQGSSDGKRADCRICNNAAVSKWRKNNHSHWLELSNRSSKKPANRERRKKYMKSYKGRVLCKICGKIKTGKHLSYCTSCYAGYKRDWYVKNREREVTRVKASAKKHIEKHRARQRKYNGSPRGKEIFKTWIRNNIDKARHSGRKNSAKRKNHLSKCKNDLTLDQWNAIKEKQKQRCYYCGKKRKLTMDHVVPLSKGGAHTKLNIVGACPYCNGSKNAKDPSVWAKQIGRLFV